MFRSSVYLRRRIPVSKAVTKSLSRSVSKWPLKSVQDIAEVENTPFLGLTQNQPLLPAQEVFTDLQWKKSDLLNPIFDWDSVVRKSAEKLFPKIPEPDLDLEFKQALRGEITEAQYNVIKSAKTAAQNQQVQERGARIDRSEAHVAPLLAKLGRAVEAEDTLLTEKKLMKKWKKHSQREKVIDTLAWSLATVAGYDSRPLLLTATGMDRVKGRKKLRAAEFRMFNKPVQGPADLYVCRRQRKEDGPEKLVIVFEDKLEVGMTKEGHWAQILGECLSLQYRNLLVEGHDEGVVYCVRVRNRHVQFFALNCSKALLQEVCLPKSSVISLSSKLSLSCHGDHTKPGLDLTVQKDRREIMQMMARIRADVLLDDN